MPAWLRAAPLALTIIALSLTLTSPGSQGAVITPTVKRVHQTRTPWTGENERAGVRTGDRPLPPWPYLQPRGGLPGIAWFGANESGFENETQLETLGNYSMIVFGWQALLPYSNYTGELSLLVSQAQIVKQRHPSNAVIVYIDGLRVQPFYKANRAIMYNPQYADFFLRDANGTFIPATTYCRQMGLPAMDPKCLCWYWNWFNSSAVDYYLNELVLPQVSKPGYDGIFFDGSDGFVRGTWKGAVNVPPNATDDDALAATVAVHKRGAQLLQAHGKYPIYSEHLVDTTPAQQAWVANAMKDTPYFRFYEGYQPTVPYIESLLNETQRTSQALPVVVHTGVAHGASITDALAAFLIIAEKYSYFMASQGWLDAGWWWHPEYNPDYGTPVGPASRHDSSNGTTIVYTREYTHCTVTVNCTTGDSGSDSDAPSESMATQRRDRPPRTKDITSSPPFNCSVFGCTCQGFADYYGTHPGRGFGCAGGDAQTWWKGHRCNAEANCPCCQGPACSLPGHAPCICPKGPPSPPPGHCTGTIRMHNETMDE
eukprot:m.146846 g.146846  ORF g.146846 m.146846 type:complete len:541 (+) comp11651_c2_seq9:195-1817(+)